MKSLQDLRSIVQSARDILDEYPDHWTESAGCYDHEHVTDACNILDDVLSDIDREIDDRIRYAPDITIIGGRVYRLDTSVPGTEVCNDD